MREILFRGQTRRKGEKVRMDGTPVESNWVYGGIFPNNDGGDFAIIYQQEPEIEKFPVYADTVCQYTGLTDKNGKKIFEGDIISTPKYGVDNGNWKNCAGKDRFLVRYADGTYYLENKLRRFCLRPDSTCEIIGNIFDNPELITSKKGAEA